MPKNNLPDLAKRVTAWDNSIKISYIIRQSTNKWAALTQKGDFEWVNQDILETSMGFPRLWVGHSLWLPTPKHLLTLHYGFNLYWLRPVPPTSNINVVCYMHWRMFQFKHKIKRSVEVGLPMCMCRRILLTAPAKWIGWLVRPAGQILIFYYQ